jgi:hypothetical protein
LAETHREDLDPDNENILYLEQKISPQNSRNSKIEWFFDRDEQDFQDPLSKIERKSPKSPE